MSFFFISYKSEDRDFALKLKSHIEEAGFLGWMDVEKLRGGDEWKLAIDTAIEASLGVIVIITVKALRSQYVTYEWSYAMGLKKPVLPVIREFPDPNNETHPKIHPRLDDIQHRRFTDESDPSTYEKEKLLSDLSAIKQATEVPDVVQKAIDQLYASDLNEVDKALQQLERINHPSVTEKLAEAARNNYDDIVKAEVALALARKSNFKDERAIPGLEIALTTHSSNAQKAIKALKQINTESAVEALVRALELPDSQLRIRKHIIIQAILEMNREPTLLVLRRIVRRTKIGDHVNAHVLQTLAQLRDQEIVPDLIERIRVHDAAKYNTQLIQALGEIRDARAVQSITSILVDTELQKDPHKEQQIITDAITTLGSIGGEESLNALREFRGRARARSPYFELLRETIKELERRL